MIVTAIETKKASDEQRDHAQGGGRGRHGDRAQAAGAGVDDGGEQLLASRRAAG